MKRCVGVSAVVIVLVGGAASFAEPTDRPILQYYDATWTTMRYRMPDIFMAGYGAVWVPPPTKGQGGANSIGYDLFDRFDLGSRTAPTLYGTEAELRLLIDSYHKADVYVYVDWIMNHNGTWDNSTPGFISQGGYPGFVLTATGDSYGDFHTYSGGCPQSTNPGDACYNLYEGRLVGLIDIAQEKNHQYIRHPATAGNPNNIPAGTVYNKVNANNAALYPDQALTPAAFANPGTTRNPGTINFTVYPYNQTDSMQGDPVIENANGLLFRATQWIIEEIGVDGLRLDAAKHIPTWFWDNYWDAAVYMRHRGFDGQYRTPYSFVEVVEGGGVAAQNWVRKPGSPDSGTGGWPPQGWEFGNRDALDLNEAGSLRDLVTADGSNSWSWVMGASFDNRDDGYNNGTIGVHHVNSHDNCIGEDENDSVAHAYIFGRTGVPICYHNALQFGSRPQNFPRENGRDDALGLGSDVITKLVQIRNGYARGWLMPINNTDPVNQSMDDVLVFTRRTPTAGPDNLLVAVNDKENAGGVETRNVQTAFPAGTRLHELTGNASNPQVDPGNQIPQILEVLSDGRLQEAGNPANPYLKIPSNKNASQVLHGRGYVIYGPAAPSGTLSVTNVVDTIPPDDASVPAYARRLTAVEVISSDTFGIQLQTTQTDPLDPNTDDVALFRIDQGFQDRNGNGIVDNPTGFSAGYEQFLTQNSPLYGGGSGVYRQTIDATQLAEGYHYISVLAFRHRDAGESIYTDFRRVIYLDREPASVALVQPTQTGDGDITTGTFTALVEASDETVAQVHFFFDLHASTDFIALAESGQGLATRDGLNFSRVLTGAIKGNHRIDVVAYDDVGNVSVSHYVGINADTTIWGGLGDINNDFYIDGKDVQFFVDLLTEGQLIFKPSADFNADGLNDMLDLPGFVAKLLEA